MTRSGLGELVEVNGEADAEGGAGGEGREIVVGLGLVVEEVVDGRVQVQAAPDVVLEHELPDGVALVDGGVARLWLALAPAREGCVEGIVAGEATGVAHAPRQ